MVTELPLVLASSFLSADPSSRLQNVNHNRHVLSSVGIQRYYIILVQPNYYLVSLINCKLQEYNVA